MDKVKTAKRKQTIGQFLNRESVAGIVCTSPFIIGFLVFMIVPMALSLYYSLCNYNILSPPTWTGLTNYIKAFTGDARFYKTLGVTFFYAIISVPLRLVFALFVAMLLVRKSRMSAFYRAVYYLPSIIGGSVAVSILWKRMFAMDGVFNSILKVIGIDTNFAWLGNTSTAIWTLIILSVWQFGSSMLIFLASIKQIPGSLYEAAEVDGAKKPTQFWRITLPLLTPTIFFNLVMQMINGFLAFTQCYIITQGKPMDSTLFYTVYMYQQSFEYYNTGYGAALAWIMLAIVGLVTAVLFATKKFWVYDGGL
ncbi:MAG: sugar ABC transporter permease [Clostridia bacterium]|nr:sugar ABC transporter permease [Clostridia bacterium]NLS85140.1 sugar ABC transporter permease [Oscillospiraceae bacterium]